MSVRDNVDGLKDWGQRVDRRNRDGSVTGGVEFGPVQVTGDTNGTTDVRGVRRGTGREQHRENRTLLTGDRDWTTHFQERTTRETVEK